MPSHSNADAKGPEGLSGRRNGATIWFRAWILQFALLALAILLYRWFGHSAIESGHAGRSFPLINEVFAERSDIPVTRFLSTADWLVDNLVFAGIVFLLVQLFAIVVMRRRRQTPVAREAGIERVEKDAEADTSLTLSGTKKVLFSLIVLLIPMLFVLLPYIARYHQYRTGLEAPPGLEDGTYDPPEMPELTPEQLLQVGKGHQARKPPLQSYLNYPREKSPGTVRVGIFGGSFSLGEEAALEHDTATHLERLLAEGGAPHVEVINFGVSGFGVSQAALLWEYIGKNYDLDYVVMMPFYFHVTRDNSFLHTDNHFGPIHGIYVAEGDTAKYVPIVGEDRLDSCRKYFSPFQPLRYWRYDDRVPMAFRPLLPQPYGRRGNPFYYADDARSATHNMYRRLYEKIAAETRQLIVFADPRIYPKLAAIHGGNIHVFPSMLDNFREPGSSLYRAPFDHPSGIGYEIYAAELAALLLGRERPEFRALWVSDELADASGSEFELKTLRNVHQTGLTIEGSVVAELRQRRAGDSRRGRYRRSVHFDEEDVSGLVMYSKNDFRLFIPLSFVPKGGDEVRLEWKQEGRDRHRLLGRVSRMRGPLGQVSLEWMRLRLEPDAETFVQWVDGDELGFLNIESRAEVSEVKVTIGGELALTGQTRELRKRRMPGGLGRLLLGDPWIRTVTVLEPTISSFMYFRGCAGQYVDVSGLTEESGVLGLRLSDREGNVDTLPLFQYQAVPAQAPPFEPRYAAPIRPRSTSPLSPER